jgi:hypothetical protein
VAVSNASREGLCLKFQATGLRFKHPPEGRFSVVAGTGKAAGEGGSGKYRRSRNGNGTTTVVTGSVKQGTGGQVTAKCHRLLDRAVGMLPSPVIAAAGDISCPGGDPPTPFSCQQRATSDLVMGPLAAILVLGDTQYNRGTFRSYSLGANAFDDTWGRVKSRIYPTPGNHEYRDPAGSAAGYYRYFGSGGPPPSPGAPRHGWYSFDRAAWHILSLNANCGVTPGDLGRKGCSPGSAQESWVRKDLAANAKSAAGGPRCILAYWHEPLFSSHITQRNPRMRAIWQDLLNAHADIVLTGHQHSYERFAPQDANGNATAAGIPQITVGTGGEDHGRTDLPHAPNSLVENSSSFGVLRMTLHPGSYDWGFVPIAGSTSGFGDAGTQPCH